MKRIACFLFALMSLFSMCACSADDSNIQVPALFYYCAATISYDSETGIIDSEIRETANFQDDLMSILNHYLQGPQSHQLSSPFPDGSCVEWLNQVGTEITLIISQSFTKLTGINLTLACACLSKTLFSLTDAQTIKIHAGHITLDGNDYITLTRDSLLLLDDHPS